MNYSKLDKVFSEWMRRKDADENGMVKCVTCDAWEHWKDMDAGHFIPRGHLMTRWYDFNVYPQCIYCNRILDGNLEAYEEFLAEKYGPDILDELWMLSRTEAHFTQAEIDELVIYYKDKIKNINHG